MSPVRAGNRPRRWGPCLATVLLILLPGLSAHANNTPCSGRKGGVERCENGRFLCRDGSLSASRKRCVAPGQGARAPGQDWTPAADGECGCASGRYCIGPRGGHYCLTPAGTKSYLRR